MPVDIVLGTVAGGVGAGRDLENRRRRKSDSPEANKVDQVARGGNGGLYLFDGVGTLPAMVGYGSDQIRRIEAGIRMGDNDTVGDAVEGLLAYPALAASSAADTYTLATQLPGIVSTAASTVSTAVSFLPQSSWTSVPVQVISGMLFPAFNAINTLLSSYLDKIIQGGKMVANWISQTQGFALLDKAIFKPAASVFQFLRTYLPVLIIINGAIQLLRKFRVFRMQSEFSKTFDLSILKDLADYEAMPGTLANREKFNKYEQINEKLKKLAFIGENHLGKIINIHGAVNSSAKAYILQSFYQKIREDYLSVTDEEKKTIRADVEKEVRAKITKELGTTDATIIERRMAKEVFAIDRAVESRVQEVVEMKATKLGKITGNYLLGEINKEIDSLTDDLSFNQSALEEAERMGKDIEAQVYKKRIVEILDTLTYLFTIAFGIAALVAGSASGITFVFFIAIWVGFFVTYLAEKQLLFHRGKGLKALHTPVAKKEEAATKIDRLLRSLAHHRSEINPVRKDAFEVDCIQMLRHLSPFERRTVMELQDMLRNPERIFIELSALWAIYLSPETRKGIREHVKNESQATGEILESRTQAAMVKETINELRGQYEEDLLHAKKVAPLFANPLDKSQGTTAKLFTNPLETEVPALQSETHRAERLLNEGQAAAAKAIEALKKATLPKREAFDGLWGAFAHPDMHGWSQIC